MADLNQFVEEMLELLNIERQTEINESKAFYQNSDNATLENKGVCLRKMVIFSQKTGLYGRTLLTLGKGNSAKNLPLPAHCITTGDIVGLSYSSEDNNVAELSSGIVTRVSETLIVVAFEEVFESQSIEEDRLMRVTRLANDVTFKRMKRALEALHNTPSSYRSSHLISVLFGDMPLGEPLSLSNLQQRPDDFMQRHGVFFNENLNESQQGAVRFALSCRDVGIIHGPPGTGKTTTIVEVIVQAVNNFGWKILACAPSNIAVDNILERLIKYNIKAVRLGHPARLMEKIHSHSLAAILESSHDTEIVKDVRRDIDTALRNLQGSRNSGERSRLRRELKTLRKELREREEKALKNILHNAQIILSTNVSASDDGPLKHLPRDHFDLVVIDEAAQSLEAACWIPLLWAPRCILAGDHKQLPPTIMSRDAARRGLEKSLMERIIEMFGDKVVQMLTTQYRMNEAIMKWSSDELYDGKLLADASVAQHLLCHLPGVNDTELTSLPLLMIDTAGCDLYELRSQDEESKGNEGEADVVAAHVGSLVNSGVKQQDIGVITPYNLQVELLRSRLSTKYPALEIKSVDGFQGREKEAVVISMVRSNSKGDIGFLAENRRMNVAVTRARRHLTMIGDSTTVSHDPFLRSLIDYINAHGEVWSAEQYRSCISGETTQRSVNKDSVKRSKDEKSKTKNSKQNKAKSKVPRPEKVHSSMSYLQTNCAFLDSKGQKYTIGDILHNREQIHTEEDNTEKLEQQIKEFLIDPKRSQLEFPANLNSYERFTVHRIAEESGLEHVSKGIGTERFIAVAKKPTLVKDNIFNEILTKQPETKAEETEIQPSDNTGICQYCVRRIPSSNMSLHEARCQRDIQRALKTCSGNISGSVDNVCSKKKGKKSGNAKKDDKKDNTAYFSREKLKGSENYREDWEKSDDFDELLSEFKRKDSQCALTECKENILTLGQKCRFCLNVYCIRHHFPDIHGCTQAAKEHARAATGRPKPVSDKAAAKRGNLERKLGNKIKDLEGKRKTKNKDKK